MGREQTYETALGQVTLASDWGALHLAFERRCGWQFKGPRQVRVEVERVPVAEMPEKPAGALDVMDAHVIVSSDCISAVVPEPSFCAGVIIDWLWLAIGKHCLPEGWMPVHAAAVADGEKITLIVGASGAGKTTALLAMLDAGMQYVSDDAVLWDSRTGDVRPWTCDLHLTPEQMQERWPELIGSTVDFNGKIRVAAHALGHDASSGGRLARIVVLANQGNDIHVSHEGVGMGEMLPLGSVDWDVPIEWWGPKPSDLAERVMAGRDAPSPSLAVCTPFSGKAWALPRWLESLDALGLPHDARFLWLCNSEDDTFWKALQEKAATLPNVQVWRDTHRVGVKDRQVTYLWQQIRSRLPEGTELVMTLEDDVLPDAGAYAMLLREWQRREGGDMVGIPVAHTYMHGEVTALAWVYETAGPRTDPRFIIADGVAAKEAMPRLGPDRVSGMSFSCALVSRKLFDSATLAPGPDAYGAGGYDHQFCMDIAAQGAQIVAHWGIGTSHLKRETGGVRDVRLNARTILIVGEGQGVEDGTRYNIVGRTPPERLIERVGDADYALFVSPSEDITAAYVDGLVDYLTWNPQLGCAWGYGKRQDGRMAPGGSESAVLVRLAAARGAPEGMLRELRAWMCREGWGEGHTDRVCYAALAEAEPVTYSAPIDRRRDASPYRVLMLNRDQYRGAWPGFGGDFTQIEGYREGLRMLGVYADLRGGQFWWHEGYEIIHLHHHQYDWAWEIAETCDGKRPVVLSAITHGRPPRQIMGRAVGLADLVVCYSVAEADFLSRAFPEKAHAMRVVPMGVDSAFLSRNGNAAPEPSVFMAGKICDYKKQLMVLDACKRLDISVAFAGFNEDPIHDLYVDEFLAAVEAYPKARMLGFLHGQDLIDAYDKAWVHVNASEFEPFGKVTLDALARRRNIVHTKESWAAEQFAECGSLCDPGDTGSIVGAIDAELRKPCGWAGVRPPSHIEAARVLKDVYEEALAG